MPYSFTPRFTKPTVTKDGFVDVIFPREELEAVILELASNEKLIALMREYISVARKETVDVSEEKEIAMRQKIFPYFDDIMWKSAEYTIFTSDVAEEMFQRLEAETLGFGA